MARTKVYNYTYIPGAAITPTNYTGNNTTTVTGTFASTAGLQTGDLINISGATGTEQSKLNGTWAITVTSSTTITFIVASSVATGALTTNLGTTKNSASLLLPGKIELSNLLMVTNTTRSDVIYNFSDSIRNAYSVTYNSPSTNTATYSASAGQQYWDGFTKFVLGYFPTGTYSVNDRLQVYVEESNSQTRIMPAETVMDPTNKMRVTTPQALIDTDFELGLQPSKWEFSQSHNFNNSYYVRPSDSPFTALAGGMGIGILAPSVTVSGSTCTISGLTLPSAPTEDSYIYIVDTTAGTNFNSFRYNILAGATTSSVSFSVPGIGAGPFTPQIAVIGGITPTSTAFQSGTYVAMSVTSSIGTTIAANTPVNITESTNETYSDGTFFVQGVCTGANAFFFKPKTQFAATNDLVKQGTTLVYAATTYGSQVVGTNLKLFSVSSDATETNGRGVHVFGKTAHGLFPGAALYVGSLVAAGANAQGNWYVSGAPTETAFRFQTSSPITATPTVIATSGIFASASGDSTLYLSTTGSISTGVHVSGTGIAAGTFVLGTYLGVGGNTCVRLSQPTTAAIPAGTLISFGVLLSQSSTVIYSRPEGGQLHRATDGGVQIQTASNIVFDAAVRQTRRYFRYQSGKGIQYSTAGAFRATYDIVALSVVTASSTQTAGSGTSLTLTSSSGFAVGMAITGTNLPSGTYITAINGNVLTLSGTGLSAAPSGTYSASIATYTTDQDHGLTPGAIVTIFGANPITGTASQNQTDFNTYNSTFTVLATPALTSKTFSVPLLATPTDTQPSGDFNATVGYGAGSVTRAGLFDEANGFYWEFDGLQFNAVRRNSITSVKGSLNVLTGSSFITGSGTFFTKRLVQGDKIVIRGMIYNIKSIVSDTGLHVSPAYRASTPAVNAGNNGLAFGSITTYTPQNTSITSGSTASGQIVWANLIQTTTASSISATASGTTQTGTASGGAGQFTFTLGATTGLFVGMFVSGAGVAAGSSITAISGNNITVSLAMTGAATATTYTFTTGGAGQFNIIFPATTGVTPGMIISGTGVPAGTYVSSTSTATGPVNGLNVFITNSMTATASGSYTIGAIPGASGSTSQPVNTFAVASSSSIVPGMIVSGTGIPTGTYVTSISTQAITVSPAITSSVTNSTALTFTGTSNADHALLATDGNAYAAGSTTITLANNAGVGYIKTGMHLAGSPNIAPGTYITNWNSTTRVATLSQATISAFGTAVAGIPASSSITSTTAGTTITTAAAHGLSVGQCVFLSGTFSTSLLNQRFFYVTSVGSTTTLTLSTVPGGSNYSVGTAASTSITVTPALTFGNRAFINNASNTLANDVNPVAIQTKGLSIALTAIGTNQISVTSTTNLYQGMPVVFTGTTANGITTGTIFFVRQILNSTDLTLDTVPNGTLVTTTTNASPSLQLVTNSVGVHIPSVIATGATLSQSTTKLFTEDIAVKCTKVREVRVASKDFNIDRFDGNGPSGYTIEASKIQMVYIDYTWYGAGFIRWGLRTNSGDIYYAHKLQHNNNEVQAYMRSGNLPGRFEVGNYPFSARLTSSIATSGFTTGTPGTITVDDASKFMVPNSATSMPSSEVTIDSEVFTYTDVTATASNSSPWFNSSTAGTVATATCTVSNGGISAITMTANGSGYTSEPPIMFKNASGISGFGATAKAILYNGTIVGIRIINGGRGYTSAPTIVIGPNQLTGAIREASTLAATPTSTFTTTANSNIVTLPTANTNFKVGQVIAPSTQFNNQLGKVTGVNSSGTQIYLDSSASSATSTLTSASLSSLTTTSLSGTGSVGTYTFAAQTSVPVPAGHRVNLGTGAAPLAYNHTRVAVTASTGGALSFAATGATADGTNVTLFFAPQTLPPFPTGGTIFVSGFTPSGFNTAASGATVVSCTVNSVTYANATTAGTVVTTAGTVFSSISSTIPSLTPITFTSQTFSPFVAGTEIVLNATTTGYEGTVIAPTAAIAASGGTATLNHPVHFFAPLVVGRRVALSGISVAAYNDTRIGVTGQTAATGGASTLSWTSFGQTPLVAGVRTTTAAVATATTTVTLGSVSGLVTGMQITAATGSTVPANTTITSIDPVALTITLSNTVTIANGANVCFTSRVGIAGATGTYNDTVVAISSITGNGTTATATINTTGFVHPLPNVGQTVAIAGVSNTGFNNATAVITGAFFDGNTATITYANATNATSSGGTITWAASAIVQTASNTAMTYMNSTSTGSAGSPNITWSGNAIVQTASTSGFTYANNNATGSITSGTGTITMPNFAVVQLVVQAAGASTVSSFAYANNATAAITAVGNIAWLSNAIVQSSTTTTITTATTASGSQTSAATISPSIGYQDGVRAGLTFASQSTVPYTVGSTIIVSGASSTSFNTTAVVTAAGNQWVQYANTNTPSSFAGTATINQAITPLAKGTGAIAHNAASTTTAPSIVYQLNNTYSPSLQHWGVSCIMDGRFDSDKSYVFTTPRQQSSVIAPGSSNVPILSIRICPSVDSGIARNFGVRSIINRMQLILSQMSVYTNGSFLLTVKLNGNSTTFTPSNWTANTVGAGSLSQVIYHNPGDNFTGGDTIFAFYANNSGGSTNFNSTDVDLTNVKDLGHSIIGGDGVYPDGPDVLTILATNLSTTATSALYSRISWTEAQA